MDGRGNVYVNGADFDFTAFLDKLDDYADDVPWRERAGFVPGYIALITPDGVVREVAGGIEFPNDIPPRRIFQQSCRRHGSPTGRAREIASVRRSRHQRSQPGMGDSRAHGVIIVVGGGRLR
ncbi:hypothetical protein ITP53_00880 [Nonomuraea sp. K274]|uniref:Uncharacterized protein n=1 Tax=Nonomuraea cypriaca TaxID=1187855 RepID=A0A931A599_9ACTN|nr:hypothetical protein [Nonomuraea cypriaca]MBF8184323.1 hypothetical protein [Nonomuraea cypriaca]